MNYLDLDKVPADVTRWAQAVMDTFLQENGVVSWFLIRDDPASDRYEYAYTWGVADNIGDDPRECTMDEHVAFHKLLCRLDALRPSTMEPSGLLSEMLDGHPHPKEQP